MAWTGTERALSARASGNTMLRSRAHRNKVITRNTIAEGWGAHIHTTYRLHHKHPNVRKQRQDEKKRKKE